MSGIVLSSAVRQNLLALQDTAASLATTQNDLSTGKKVNSALDNPTNFFTAAGLDNRASDISNLLDGISNGVQVLQAANTGITSVESLVSQAKSIANQALQAPIGYSAKASITSAAITNNGAPATASNLLGTGTVSAGTVTGTAVTTGGPLTGTTKLSSLGFQSSDQFNIGGVAFSFTSTSGNSGSNLDLSTATVDDFLTELTSTSSDILTSNISGGQITISSGGSGFTVHDVSGTDTADLFAYQGGPTYSATSPVITTQTASTASTDLSALTTPITSSDTLTVNGHTISLTGSGSNSFSSTGATLNAATATTQDVLTAINTITGGTSSIDSSGDITVSGVAGATVALTGSALSKLGLTSTTGNSASVSVAGAGQTLTFGAIGTGAATTVTFGTGSGQVSTLDQLNTQLATDNLQATLDTSGKLTFTTTNDAASASIGTVGGTAVSNSAGAFHGQTASAPVADAAAQTTRATLVSQYNAILTQIDNTAADASYNGVNLLNGDQLQLTFNETGKSKLNITGVNFGSAGLGLSALTNTSFQDNDATNSVLTTLNTVSSTLRSEASALGSNLSVVQTRQDFNTSLINVLQTGSANLTQADINLEAANSQALSTRQSLSVSALSLANQSQQSVLQLLR